MADIANQNGNARKSRKPPLIVTDTAPEGTSVESRSSGTRRTTSSKNRLKGVLPSVVGMLIPLVVSFAGIMFATMYRVPWLVIVSCIIAGVTITAWILHRQHQVRWEESIDLSAREEKVRAYRRDLEETLIGYDIDGSVSEEQIEALVAEYRHKLEVESTNLAVAGPVAIARGLLGKRKPRKQALSEEAAARAAAAEARRMLVRQDAAERKTGDSDA